MLNIREKIKKRREELGYTLLQVSEKVGISAATYQRYESGEIDIGNVHLDKIEKVAKALNWTPAFLLGWEKEQIRYEDIVEYARKRNVSLEKVKLIIDILSK